MEIFPDESVAVQVMVVSPSGNDFGASFVTESTLIASVASAFPIDTIVSDFEVASWVMSAGTEMIGAVVSTTDIVWVAVFVFPEVSVTVQVTVVSPSLNDSGASFVTDSTSTRSAVFGWPSSTILPDSAVASNLTFAGAEIVGLVVSIIVTF